MKVIRVSVISLFFLVQAAAAQSLGDLARQERERKAREQKASIQISTDELASGKLDVSPRLDPARRGELDYLLTLLSHPKVSPELLRAFVPLEDRAVPKLLPMLESTDALKRVGPATALMVMSNTEGLASMARVLNAATEAASAGAAGKEAAEGQTTREKMEANRQGYYALNATKFGVWRFTEGSAMTPDQVIQRLQKGPAIEIVGGVDNGQRIFNAAFRQKDPNIRLGAIALIRVASGGQDFGFQPEQPAEQNEAALQQITTFLTTERGKVISELGAKPQ